MGNANISRQSLVEAIATLEAQRGLASGDRQLQQAVDTVLLVLRDKLAQVQADLGGQTRHHLAILVADLSGYTALSERMDVDRVRAAINAMWDVLDAVIHAWGGQIDQHAGDSLMALFGLPHPRQGDAAAALHAALSMQQELQLFNERVRQAADNQGDESWVVDWPGPNMRIGVHSGPVFFAHAPGGTGATAGRATAVGDTVLIARRLEKLAPAGSVLTSETTRRQTHNRFNFVEKPELVVSTQEDDQVFLVTSERSVATDYSPGTVAGKVSRLVGRTDMLDRLQMALQTATDSRTPQLVTIVGRPGAGKSRLVYEFERQARLLGNSPTILRAGTQGAFPDFPFALVRDLLSRRFSIRPQASRFLVEHKLREGLGALAGAWQGADSGQGRGEPQPIHAPTLDLLEKVLDARTAAMLPLDEVLAVVESLLRAITAADPAIVILEGINRADRQSLDLVHQLVRNGESGPVLFLGLATVADATDPEWILPWLSNDEDIFSPVERLDVQTLSPVDSRLMATEILSALAPPPMRLLDLVVAEAGGNPLYIEEFSRFLMDSNIIVVGERWRVDMDRAEKIVLPAGLSKLFELQLAKLPEAERKVLQYAAVFGPLCWDTALLELIPANEVSEVDVDGALLSLEMKGYLIHDDIYGFAGAQAYAFRRDSVREAAYAGIPLPVCRAIHLDVALWLIAHQDDARLNARFSIDTMIARHFAAAGDMARSDIWQKRSGIPVNL